jgi:hypothetical protein
MRTKGLRLQAYASAAPAFAVTGLFVLWAEHDGGYDQDTWYWGALVVLGLLVLVAATRVRNGQRLPQATLAALVALALYVGWSYLSISWAGSPGDALTGSNRALLYLLVFALFVLAPWAPPRALGVLLGYALGVGAVGALVLVKMAAGGHTAGALFTEGRLVSPEGYFNATAALFTSSALVSVSLAARRELPPALRGLLMASACGCLQLALLGQSRGWLFTLPLVVVAAIAISRDRARVCLAALLPLAGTLAALPKLLDVFRSTGGARVSTAALADAAASAARTGLLLCAGVLVAGTLIAAGELRLRPPALAARTKRALAAGAIVTALLVVAAGGVAATHGHPFRFISRQWHGFTHPSTSSSAASHFGTVGSSRYDFWRVGLDAFVAHPISGLGQDNFDNYYVKRRRTGQEPSYVHSLEIRLLTHTGIVGFLLFGAFVVAALGGAIRGSRRVERATAAVACAALMPLVVWLIHGSVDWFWEIPALSGPALGFLGMSLALATPAGEAVASQQPDAAGPEVPRARRFERARLKGTRAVWLVAAALAVGAAVVVLWFPYLSVREVSTATDVAARNPSAALSDLATAADLNPLSADPGRLAGVIALQNGDPAEAQRRFRQSIERDPGGWFAWLGAGLAASALGERDRAERDFVTAEGINSRQPATVRALALVRTGHPLTPSEALGLLILQQ